MRRKLSISQKTVKSFRAPYLALKKKGHSIRSDLRLLTNSARDESFIFLPGRWSCYETQGNGVFICCPCLLGSEIQRQSKTVGVARQQLHFLCSDKENEAKESFALRWACLVRQGGNLNSVKTVRLNVYISPAGDEALESLYFCGGLQR